MLQELSTAVCLVVLLFTGHYFSSQRSPFLGESFPLLSQLMADFNQVTHQIPITRKSVSARTSPRGISAFTPLVH